MSNKYIADYQRKELRGPVTMEKPLNYGLYELGEHRLLWNREMGNSCKEGRGV